MAEDERSDAERPRDSGIFGNLPRSRPGIPSPRRSGSVQGRPSRGRKEAAPPTATPPLPRAARRSRPLEAEPVVEEEQIGGLEELAWAGLAVAAEAATAGIRIVNRALEAAREAVERR